MEYDYGLSLLTTILASSICLRPHFLQWLSYRGKKYLFCRLAFFSFPSISFRSPYNISIFHSSLKCYSFLTLRRYEKVQLELASINVQTAQKIRIRISRNGLAKTTKSLVSFLKIYLY